MTIIITILTAFGLLAMLWVLFGWLLPGSRGRVICICESPNAAFRIRQLHRLGLLRGHTILVWDEDLGVPLGQEIERIRREELLPLLEREIIDGTGTGDSVRLHPRGGL